MTDCLKIDIDSLFTFVAEEITSGRSVTLYVRGESMAPMLRSNRDIVTLSPFLDKKIFPGDVVMTRTVDSRIVLHRVVKRRGGLIELMGDGSLRAREVARISEVAGVVSRFERAGKQYTVDGTWYRRYVSLWTRLRPFRRPLLWLYFKIAGR